jgi:predicted ribosome quality control (RQC) complex YloA/Tae2 family protein
LPDFRIYKLAEGFEVWVGKDSKSNDLLSMKFTENNDLWFHVRGSSGAHTVLKVEKSKDQKSEINKDYIIAAAAIAAYHSKARNAKKVTVAYTLGKYVNKYRGAKTGSVVVKNEKIVKVEPKLPE